MIRAADDCETMIPARPAVNGDVPQLNVNADIPTEPAAFPMLAMTVIAATESQIFQSAFADTETAGIFRIGGLWNTHADSCEVDVIVPTRMPLPETDPSTNE